MEYNENPIAPLTVKEMDPMLQPREKALMLGIRALEVHELLALILRTGTTGNPITHLTKGLIEAHGGSLHSLGRKTRKELMLTRGLGEIKAMQVEAIMQLAKLYAEEERRATNMENIIRCSDDIYQYIRHTIANEPHEQIWAITINRRNKVIGKHHVTTGSATASVFDVKTILKLALLDNAEGLVMCHNHPSGNLLPSPQDDTITHKLYEAAAAMDLRMLDHLIVTVNGYYSYADEGRLK